MSEPNVSFQKIDLRSATEQEYIQLNKFKNRMNAEYRPDDPPIPLEENVQGWKHLPELLELEAYVLWDPSHTKIIASCDAEIYHTGDNEHAAEFNVEVLPEYRQKGIGGQALKLLLPFVQSRQRTLLVTFASDRIPETTIVLERLGARKGLEMHINQLKVSEFDKTLVQKWLTQSEKYRSEFDVTFTEGAYPDEIIGQIAELFREVTKDQPRDNLEMEDMNFTPEILRQWEQTMISRGTRRWTMYLTDCVNGNVAGLTEVFWNPNRAMILNQGFTGVYPKYRSKGLGRWLKAEMMNKILRERPEVEFIRTGNANSNAPMLKINVEMGFKPYIANTIWQVNTEQIETYLRGQGNKTQ